MSQENRNEPSNPREPIEPIDSSLFGEPSESAPKKPQKKISLTAFLFSAVALVLAAVMLTYTLCENNYRQRLAATQTEQNQYKPFEVIEQIFSERSFEEMDEEEMLAMALKAYVYATGDRYADYYTEEEYAELTDSRVGNSVGIGINVVETTVTVNGYLYKAFCVVNVMHGSPAEQAGLQMGDMIWAIGTEDDLVTVGELDYDLALTRLKGEEGTVAKFSLFRMVEGEYPPEPLYFSVTRAKVTASSVRHHVSTTDPSVGIIKIIQFDLTTPTQFKTAVNSLMEAGCKKFVFDVRYNPGGDLSSISAVLSYFLQEGDVVIRTEDVSGKKESATVGPVLYGGDYAGCSVLPGEIGMYRELDAVVLCNGSTASAGELFVATFMDYGIAPVIGTKTFGKGSMQTFLPLEQYGCKGVLKLTTARYFSAKRDSYDGIGIDPDEVVELSEEAAKQNVYMLSEADDNQLQAALAKLLSK